MHALVISLNWDPTSIPCQSMSTHAPPLFSNDAANFQCESIDVCLILLAARFCFPQEVVIRLLTWMWTLTEIVSPW